MSEKLDPHLTIYQDGGMYKGVLYKNNKYYFNDTGQNNYYDAIMDTYEMAIDEEEK